MFNQKEYDKKYYQNNKAKIIKQSEDYYLKNRGKILKWHKEYRLKNKERISEYHKKHYPEVKEKRAEYHKKYYQENKEDILKKTNKYHKINIEKITARNRNHTLSTNGERFHQINKRKYTGFCEICGEKAIKLFYHHWNNKNFMEGIWVCQRCHWFVEGIDSGCDEKSLKKYLDLKEKIKKEEK